MKEVIYSFLTDPAMQIAYWVTGSFVLLMIIGVAVMTLVYNRKVKKGELPKPPEKTPYQIFCDSQKVKKAALIVAIPLVMTEIGMAQTMIDPGYSNGGYGSGNSYSYYPSGPSGGQLYTVYQNVNQEQTMSPFMRFLEQLLHAMSGDPNHGMPSSPYMGREGGNGGQPPRQQN